MVTFLTGSAPGTRRPRSAWPDSWNAIRSRSWSDSRILRSLPSKVFSIASAKSAMVTAASPFRAAPSAASLTRLRRSAPTRPGVCDATWSRSASGASGTLRVWMRRIAARPRRSGGCTVTRRSKRPGRRSAGSRTSARLVAASTITPSRESKPSISVRIWLRVCSCSSLPPILNAAARLRPKAPRIPPAPAEAARLGEVQKRGDDQDRRPEAREQSQPHRWRRVWVLGVDDHLVLLKGGFEVVGGEGRTLGLELGRARAARVLDRVLCRARDRLASARDAHDVAGVDLVEEGVIRDRDRRRLARREGEVADHDIGDEQDREDHPEAHRAHRGEEVWFLVGRIGWRAGGRRPWRALCHQLIVVTSKVFALLTREFPSRRI